MRTYGTVKDPRDPPGTERKRVRIVALPLQFKRLRLQLEYTKMRRGVMW